MLGDYALEIEIVHSGHKRPFKYRQNANFREFTTPIGL